MHLELAERQSIAGSIIAGLNGTNGTPNLQRQSSRMAAFLSEEEDSADSSTDSDTESFANSFQFNEGLGSTDQPLLIPSPSAGAGSSVVGDTSLVSSMVTCFEDSSDA